MAKSKNTIKTTVAISMASDTILDTYGKRYNIATRAKRIDTIIPRWLFLDKENTSLKEEIDILEEKITYMSSAISQLVNGMQKLEAIHNSNK